MTDYYPFGEIRSDQTTTAHKNNYKFTGKELDTENGLYYYSSRYYDAKSGRFISKDSWEGKLDDPQSLNKYTYVRNNPLKYTDPTGKCFWDACLAETSALAWIGGAIVGALTVGYGAYSVTHSDFPKGGTILVNTPPPLDRSPFITSNAFVNGATKTSTSVSTPKGGNILTTPAGTINTGWIETMPVFQNDKGR